MEEEQIIDEIRKFNRHYVRSIGLLEKTFLNSDYSLTEGQLLFLVKERGKTTATEINKILKLDEGYLSRIIKKLIANKLLVKEQSKEDKRCYEIKLTKKGVEKQRILDQLSSASVEKLIAHLSFENKAELADAFQRIMTLLYGGDNTT